MSVGLSKLETSGLITTKTQTPSEVSHGWKSVTNWRKLATNMNSSEVQKILGEPERLDGGTVANWYYQNGGTVIFVNETVLRWIEPRK